MKRIRDILFPEGGKARKKLRKWNRKLHGLNNDLMATEDYAKWINLNEPTMEELDEQRRHKFEKNPKISVVVPMYNTPVKFFRELVQTLIGQTYENWELCLIDASPKKNRKLKEICLKDNRIKYNYTGNNLGIAGNTNEAIKIATGEYIALLDHDDLLSINCLYEVVKVINNHPNAEFIYSDEDKIEDDVRFQPHFKPDFAIDTLRMENYICHFSVFKKEVMDKLEGERSSYDGAQDFDLILRMAEIVKKENIYHIPKVLYHWRISATSTAGSEEAKPYAYISGEKAVQDHLNRMNIKAKAYRHPKYYGLYDIIYEIEEEKKVNIIIPNKDNVNMLKNCIKSIINKTTYKNYEIDIIDNNSIEKKTFEYYNKIEKNEKIKVLKYNDKGFNYSKIINYGVKNTDGEFILQLNNDTEVIAPDWLKRMVGVCQREDVGVVGAKLYYKDGTIQHTGIILGMTNLVGHINKGLPGEHLGYFARCVVRQDLEAVTGACLLSKRSVYEKVGYMNENLAVAFNDVDFCLKVRKNGLLVVYEPTAELYHYESKTRGQDVVENKNLERFDKEIATFKQIWKEELENGDPYYNPNLDLNDVNAKICTQKINYRE